MRRFQPRAASARRALATACAAALVLAAPAGLGAQEWRLDAQGGQLRFDASPAADASATALGGLRYLNGATWLGIYGGLPMDDGDAPWGLATGNLRLQTGERAFRFGVDLAGELFLQGSVTTTTTDSPLPGLPGRPGSDPVTETTVPAGMGLKAEAMPLVAYDRTGWGAELRVGAARYHSDFGGDATDRDVAQLHAQVSASPLPALSVSAEARHYAAEEGGYPYLGLTAAGMSGPLLAWASVGRWLEDGLEEMAWAAGGRLDVVERAALTASVRHAVFDPLYLTSGTTSWSLGLSVLLQGPPAPAAPVPASYEDGVAVIALDRDDARGAPLVAGDFNDWEPQAMRAEDGRWVLPVRLEPGVYYYAFVTEDGTWYVPDGVPGRQDDGFGGHVAVLVVE
ncbi:MAG: glycogen-binding domain-containing protein [Gemmatimonadota bacterium]